MWDASNYKLYNLEDDITQIFKFQGVSIDAVKILTAPRRFSKWGIMTFVIPDKNISVISSLTKPLELALGYKFHILSESGFNKELTIESNYRLDFLSDIFKQGKSDEILRGEIIQNLKIIQASNFKQSSLKDASQLPPETFLAIYRIAKESHRIMGSSPSSLEDTLFATFDKKKQSIIKAAAKWNPLAAVNNRVSKKLTLLLKHPEIMSDLIRNVRNELGQTCLQIAMINRHGVEVSKIVNATKSLTNFDIVAYLDTQDSKKESHWETAKKCGFDLYALFNLSIQSPASNVSCQSRPLSSPNPHVGLLYAGSTHSPVLFRRSSDAQPHFASEESQSGHAPSPEQNIDEYCRNHPDKIDDLIARLTSIKLTQIK